MKVTFKATACSTGTLFSVNRDLNLGKLVGACRLKFSCRTASGGARLSQSKAVTVQQAC